MEQAILDCPGVPAVAVEIDSDIADGMTAR
jgi:hypothetical protein